MALTKLTDRNLKVRYRLSYEAALKDQPWDEFVRRVDTNQPGGEEFGGNEPISGMRRSRGDQSYDRLIGVAFPIAMTPYENGFVVPMDDWNFEKVGAVSDSLKQLSGNAASHMGELVEDLIEEADDVYDPIETTIKYFSTAHVLDDASTQSNYLKGDVVTVLNVSSKTAPTVAEWQAALPTLGVTMMQLTDRQGHFVNRGATSFTIAVPAVLFPNLEQAINQRNINGGGDNPVEKSMFSFIPMLLPGCTETYKAFMFVNGRSPIVMQVLRDPGKLIVKGPGSDYWDTHDAALCRCRGKYGAGWDNYQHAAMLEFT